MRWLRLTFSTLLISGCINSDPATDLVETYASRTANAIEKPFDLHLLKTAELYPTLPPRRERLAPIEPIREGLLELLDLRHCNLMQLVAERNTSLGRVATGSQRLIYELEFFPAAKTCIRDLEKNPDRQEMVANLKSIVEIKSASLPNQIWNSIYTSPEMEQHFSLGELPLPPNTPGLIAPITPTLERFAQIAALTQQSNWQTPDDITNLESHFETLYRSQFGAQWLASMALLTQTLEQTANAIELKLQGRPICFNRQQNNQSKILWNVFMNFYVNSLQPYIAQVEKEGRIWSELNRQIIYNLAETPRSQHIEYLFAEQGPIWHPYLSARKRHTEAWQQILEQCNLRPGSKQE